MPTICSIAACLPHRGRQARCSRASVTCRVSGTQSLTKTHPLTPVFRILKRCISNVEITRNPPLHHCPDAKGTVIRPAFAATAACWPGEAPNPCSGWGVGAKP